MDSAPRKVLLASDLCRAGRRLGKDGCPLSQDVDAGRLRDCIRLIVVTFVERLSF